MKGRFIVTTTFILGALIGYIVSEIDKQLEILYGIKEIASFVFILVLGFLSILEYKGIIHKDIIRRENDKRKR
jgi:hypothetical protein